MDNLKTTTKIVKAILTGNHRARSSDDYLYYLVCNLILAGQGKDIENIGFADALLNRKEYGLPPFESVRRSRQKVQQHHPDLAAAEKVEALRMVKEEEYRDYARGVV